MTWIRVDTELRDHKVVGQLAKALGVPLSHALGMFVACELGFGEHQKDGMPAEIADDLLEQWALWRGKSGKFAAAFRTICIEAEEGKKDPVGRIKGWWRQDALIRKQEKDRQKPAGNARNLPESPDIPPEIPRGNFGCNEDEDGDVNGTTQTTTTARGPSSAGRDGADTSPESYAQQCTGACNRGLRQNTAYANGRGFNELVTSSQLEHVESWQKAGIPVNFAAGIILTRAAEYKPNRRYPQPINLRYFDKGVREAWERSNAATASEGVTPIAPDADDDDITRAGRKLAAKLGEAYP